MIEVPSDKSDLARGFAEELDAIASRGAAPDCAEQLADFHTWFDAECARLQEVETARAADQPFQAETARR